MDLNCSVIELVLFGGTGWSSGEEFDLTGAIDDGGAVSTKEVIAVSLLSLLDKNFPNIASTAALVALLLSA